jgi:hypothetical protein
MVANWTFDTSKKIGGRMDAYLEGQPINDERLGPDLDSIRKILGERIRGQRRPSGHRDL